MTARTLDAAGTTSDRSGRALASLAVLALVVASMVGLPAPVAADGETITVTAASAVASPDCTDGSDDCTLQEAVAVAGDGDVIVFAAGVDPVITSQLQPSGDITIRGNTGGDGGPGTTITISAANRLMQVAADRTVVVENVVLAGGELAVTNAAGGAIRNLGSLTLHNVAVVDNRVEGSGVKGGGVYNDPGATLVIEASRFDGNEAIRTVGAGVEGGAIYNSGGTVRISDSVFADNFSELDGGAIANRNEGSLGVLEITGSRFVDNQAGVSGGAILGFGTLAIADTVFEGNIAGAREGGTNNGGALDLRGSNTEATIDGSVFRSNRAEAGIGGAILRNAADLIVTRTVFDGNRSGHTGGVASFFGGSLTVEASTFTGNVGTAFAGALLVDGSSDLTVRNTTVSGNTSDFAGGVFASGNASTSSLTHVTVVDNDGFGVFQGGDFDPTVPGLGPVQGSAELTLAHSLVADNGEDCGFGEAGDGVPLVSAGHNLDSDGTCALGDTDATATDVGLGALADNGGPTPTHLPDDGSPAVDGGSDGPCLLGTDQRGEPRPGANSSACDIGAVEVQSATQPPDDDDAPDDGEPTDTSTDDDDDGDGEDDADADELTEAQPATPIARQPDYTG